MPSRGSRYWAGRGRYQKEWDTLYEKLVPSSGPCATVAGEAIRAASKLCYEMNNNGWGNNVSGPYFYLSEFFDTFDVDFDAFAYFEDPSFDGWGRDESVEGDLIDKTIDHVYKVIAIYHPELQTQKNSKDMWRYRQNEPERPYESEEDSESEEEDD
jgi:hypothetical protein